MCDHGNSQVGAGRGPYGDPGNSKHQPRSISAAVRWGPGGWLIGSLTGSLVDSLMRCLLSALQGRQLSLERPQCLAGVFQGCESL